MEAAGTQWRATGFGVVGLDYPAVFAVAERMGMEIDEEMMHRIRAVERVELTEQAKRAKKPQEKTDG